MKRIEMSKLADSKYRPTEFPPSMVEPDQSLSIQEIMLNVARTGQTGLPSGAEAVYDDTDQNNDDGDFNDPTLDVGLDKLEALQYQYDVNGKWKQSIANVQRRNERLELLRRRKAPLPQPLNVTETSRNEESSN